MGIEKCGAADDSATSSQPATQEQVHKGDHHYDPEHHEGRERDERHRAYNTPLFGPLTPYEASLLPARNDLATSKGKRIH
jgi:hypothetical protein